MRLELQQCEGLMLGKCFMGKWDGSSHYQNTAH